MLYERLGKLEIGGKLLNIRATTVWNGPLIGLVGAFCEQDYMAFLSPVIAGDRK